MKKVFDALLALSVQVKLAVLIFMVTLAISSVSILINIDMHKNQTNRIIDELIRTNIDSNSAFVSQFILTRNQWELYKFLKTLSASEMIESCGFIDNHYRVVAHTDTEHYRIRDTFNDFEEHILVPFIQDGVEFGSFVLKVHTQTFLGLAKESFFIQILMLVVVALLSLVIANIFMSRLLGRLDLLSNNAQAMIEKRWDDITIYQGRENDEITRIIETTTQLMHSLKESIEKEEKNARISHSLIILGEISSSFAHEVKNLLQPLKLLIPKTTPPDKEDMPIINGALSRIDHQVADFLALAKPADFHLEHPLHVKPFVEESVGILNARLHEKNLSIEAYVAEDFLVKLNAKAIELIVMNLLSNAIDAAFENSVIELTWNATDEVGLSLLCVRNCGESMDERTKENLFKPFFTTKKEGSGLGLFSIYKIVYLSGGHIEFESQEEQTKFCLYIPTQESA
jgi:two-component system, sporulation sensor kinase C